MKHRIRAAGLLVNNDRLLLVLERNVIAGKEFWIPPGGGIEPEDDTVISCVRREFLEETGLSVEVGGLVYVREYIETSNDTHHLELFFRVHQAQGQIHTVDPSAPPAGSDLIRYARWFRQNELDGLDLAPQELRDSFWKDFVAGTTETRYLGVNVEKVS